MHSKLVYPLLITLLIVSVSSSQKEIQISVQLGQVYRYDIPIFFNNYQESTLLSFKNVKRNYSLPLQICQIRVSEQGNLSPKTKLTNSSGLNQYNRDRVIYRLKDLQQSKIVIDSITINQQIIALYPPNQIIIYSVDSQATQLKKQTDFRINGTTDDQLLEALFMQIDNTVLLVSGQGIRKIYTNGSYSVLTGYKPVSFSVTSVQYLENKLYIGLGQHGLTIYELDSSLSTLTLAFKTQFVYSQNNQTVSFDVDEFQIYPIQAQVLPSSKSIYVLDYVQGLIQITLDKLKPEQTYTAKPRFLASSCRNLIVTWNSIYLSCPQLVEISRQKYAVSMLKETNFLSQSVKLQKDRLYLFGTQDFAVFDIFGKTLAQYQLPSQSQLSTMVEDYLLTFESQDMVLYSISPQKQQLYCYATTPDRIGEYTGIIQTGGICKQHTGSSQITKRAWQNYCLVDTPIRVTLKNTAQINLKIELLVGGVILCLIILFGLYLCFKHCQAYRNYGKLNEQQFKQLQEVGSQIMTKQASKQSKEEVEKQM